MLSNKNIKYIRSLHQKKYREKHNCFLAEGEKIISEVITLFKEKKNIFPSPPEIFATDDWLIKNDPGNDIYPYITKITHAELKKISLLKTPQKVLAILPYFNYTFSIKNTSNNISLVLDEIKDPGNIGTIIRTADWFGIKNIFCSKDSVDMYNPKVIQSSMGAFLRVSIHYVNIYNFLKDVTKEEMPIVGTFLDGDRLFEANLPKQGLFLFGNESKGIREELKTFITNKITIPGTHSKGAESLNISIATGIVCSELKRRKIV